MFILDFHDCLNAVKRYFWLIVAVTVIAAVFAWAISVYVISPQYESRAMISISKMDTKMGEALLDSNSIRFFYNIAESDTVAENLIQKLNQSISVEELRKQLHTDVDYETGILNISVRTGEPAQSKTIADTFIEVLNGMSDNFLDVNIHVIDEPKLSSQPVSPNVMLNTLLSAVGGFMAGLILAILFSIREQTKTDIYALSKIPELYVMGFIPKGSRIKNSPFFYTGDSRVEEAAKSIRKNMQFLMERDGIKTVMVTSPGPTEGKTTLAVNLALWMAQINMRVLLVDSNFEKPSFYNISNVMEKSDEGNAYHAVDEYFVKSVGSEPKIDIIMAPQDDNSIDFSSLRTLLEHMEPHYDLILLDCPPLATDADALTISGIAKNVLLMADYRLLNYKMLEKCVNNLRQIHASIMGIVVNRMPSKRLPY